MANEGTEVKETQVAEPDAVYDLHIRVPKEMQGLLKNAAEMACKLGDMPKPELANLMNLFITWGLNIQKQKWLNRMGYR